MRCIYINIPAWVIQIALVYIMFATLLGDATVIAIGAMFTIYYVEFIRDIICRRINVKRELFGQFKELA